MCVLVCLCMVVGAMLFVHVNHPCVRRSAVVKIARLCFCDCVHEVASVLSCRMVSVCVVAVLGVELRG